MGCRFCHAFDGVDRCPVCHPKPVYVPQAERRGRGKSLSQQARETRVSVLQRRLKAAQRVARNVSRAAQKALGEL